MGAAGWFEGSLGLAIALLIMLSGFSGLAGPEGEDTPEPISAIPPETEQQRGPTPVGGNTLIVDEYGGGNYTNIQDAIDNASSGDTIRIWEGVYENGININKSVTIIGNGTDITVLKWVSGMTSVRVTEDNVSISRLSVKKFTWASNSPGLWVLNADNCTIHHVGINGNSVGLQLSWATNCTVYDCTFDTNSYTDAYLYCSEDNEIRDSDLMSESVNGLDLHTSHGNRMSRNHIANRHPTASFTTGVNFYDSDHNQMLNNTISDYYYGVLAQYSSGNNLTGNQIDNTTDDVRLEWCAGFVLTKNALYERGITIYSTLLEQWDSHEIQTSNTVGGNPLLYLVNQSTGIVPSGYGQMILVNCSQMYISDIVIDKSGVCITMAYCDNNTMTHCSLSSSWGTGIYLWRSSDNVIENCNLSDGDMGLQMVSLSYRNIVRNNTCVNNSRRGIQLDNAHHSTILNNTCRDNGESGVYILHSHEVDVLNNVLDSNDIFGVFVGASSEDVLVADNVITGNGGNGIAFASGMDHVAERNQVRQNSKGITVTGGRAHISYNQVEYNTVAGIQLIDDYWWSEAHHNNIVNNGQQGYDVGGHSWDNGKREGNYWSDYTGVDSGENYRTIGDGIGDTDIPHLSWDYYPFVAESGWEYPGIPIIKSSSYLYDEGNFTVSWIFAARATHYRLEVSTDPTFLNATVHVEYEDEYVKFTDVEDGTYYYRVRAHKDNNMGSWSNVINITVDRLPATPRNFNVTRVPEGNALNITWTPNEDEVEHYRVMCRFGTVWTWLGKIYHPGSYLIHDGIDDGIEYSYYIQAVDARGQMSPQSKVVKRYAEDTVVPLPPENLRVGTVNSYTCLLTWDISLSLDVVTYNIYRSTEPEPEDWGQPVNGHSIINTPTFTDVNLTELTKYHYMVTAEDEVPNESDPTEVVSNTTTRGPHAPGIHETPDDVYMWEDRSVTLYNCLDEWFFDPNRDKLAYSCPNPGPFSVFIYPDNGTLVLLPDKNWCGQEKLTFTASDGEKKVSDTMWVSVRAVNDPPMIHTYSYGVNGTRTDVHEDDLVDLTVHCTDPDTLYGDLLVVEWTSSIHGTLGTRAPEGNVSTLTGIALSVGTHTITIKVTDEDGAIAMVNFTVTVFETVWGDMDGDGMPNGWERDNNLDPYEPMDAFEDPDDDGYSNLEEYMAGTDPWYNDRPDSPYETPSKKTDPDPRPNYSAYYVLLALAVLIPVIVMLVVAWRRRPRRKVDDGVPMLVPETFDGGFKKPRHRSPYDRDVEDGDIIDIGGEGGPVPRPFPKGDAGGGFPKEQAIGSGAVVAHNRLLPAVKVVAGGGEGVAPPAPEAVLDPGQPVPVDDKVSKV